MAQASSPNLIWFRTPPWTDISAHLRVSLYFCLGHFGARRNLTVTSVYASSDLSVSRRFSRTLLRGRASFGLGEEPSEATFGTVSRRVYERLSILGPFPGRRSLRHVRRSVYGGIGSAPSVYPRVRIPAALRTETVAGYARTFYSPVNAGDERRHRCCFGSSKLTESNMV